MGTWDKAALRFIALLLMIVAVGIGLKFASEVQQVMHDSTAEQHEKDNKAITGEP